MSHLKDQLDIFVWPEGSWCYRFEYSSDDFSWKSDDFCVIYLTTPEWREFLEKEGEYDD
ncbi:hypothetical protein NVX19_003515 [Salmonella enterica]|nr:hypothetical protein [Salmonella enterica]